MSNYRFILSGGGTGGHIYPAISIANALKERYPEAEFLFVGARDKMEMEKVPQSGFKIEGLWISGIQRKLTLKNLMFPFKLLSSLARSKSILRKFQPDLVIGTGGFASGPLLKVASSVGVPCVLQEQNSYPGITNKWLSGNVEKIFVAYDGLERFFPKDKIVKTGNPVRQDLLELTGKKEKAMEQFKLDPEKPVLFVMGGSLGARRINQLVEKKLGFFAKHGVQLLWQCGKLYFEEYKACENDNVRVLPFINNMDLAYAAADLIISRAGAGSVSELTIVGKPVIFIPSPNVAEDHQTKNAEAVVSKEAAILLKETELNDNFEEVFGGLLADENLKKRLSENIRSLALPEATAVIVEEIERILKSGKAA
ncbi:undecaprenyldiphospho-muramoylpentapeptide beta-N-acetylglucosaminyltransferase [Robertkochia solimangrovi]|uniref:undecaprenyldiphospho-muramoylpentapeptide beta-N-acetylglucosaminyltransferase n=1 Tax=Robertkochia solimangrovi TaxID=2213046 RepID=UPI00117E4716|nr:undecaprenyldiphospho-muramoylpentapeptide beta-N-acetylglucosaminyltransferase [Robertkochia solimangrovi]TRZ44358.1 undecaprenyldiphospho-muramoylpentapeptide beta-N-acetylglucosaminyltransferase [Robertkochia solimangrovi]